jgi:hypothetical protein
MASTVKRRPLPALIALLALLLLTGLVWWRVLGRDKDKHDTAAPCPTVAPSVVLPAPSGVTLLVLNATTRAGIAGKARTVLSEIGFDIPGAAGNDVKSLNKIKTVGQIRYGPAGAKSARLVAYYLPGATLVPTKSKSATVGVSLGKQYRGVASAASVRARLKAHNTVAGTPAPAASDSASCAPQTASPPTSSASSASN